MFKHSDPSDHTDEEAEQIVRDNQEREKQEKEKGSNTTNTKAGTTQTTSTLIKPVSITDLIESNPGMRPVVIDGILRRGETANIIAAAKVGKSHLAHSLAWCIVTGMPWLSHDVAKGRVLIIDNELHPETLANRLDWIANKLMIEKSDYIDSIDVVSLGVLKIPTFNSFGMFSSTTKLAFNSPWHFTCAPCLVFPALLLFVIEPRRMSTISRVIAESVKFVIGSGSFQSWATLESKFALVQPRSNLPVRRNDAIIVAVWL